MKTTFSLGSFLILIVLWCTTEPVTGSTNSDNVSPQSTADSILAVALKHKMANRFDRASLLLGEAAQKYHGAEAWEQYIETQHHLAYCLWITHRADEAVTLSKRMIEETEQRLQANHILLAPLYTILGNVYADRRTQESYQQCISYYEKALKITEQWHGSDHPALAEAYERLGIARFLIDDYSGAIPYYEKALTFLKKPTPENANSYSKIHNNLGLIYLGMGYLEKAKEYFEKAYHDLVVVQGKTDPRAARVLKNIGNIHAELGDFEEALVFLEEARRVDAQTGEPGSKLKAYIKGSLGDCHLAKGEFAEAIRWYQACLEYWNPNLRDDVNGRVQEYSKIGECYLKLGQINLAIDYLKKARRLLNTYYDQDNLNWVGVWSKFGLAYRQKGNVQKAEHYLQLALTIALEKLGNRHPTVGQIKTELARLDFESGNLETSLKRVQQARASLLFDEPESITSPPVENISSLVDYVGTLELEGQIKMGMYRHYKQLDFLEEALSVFRRGIAYSDSLKMTLQSGSALRNAQQQVFKLSESALDCLYALWSHSQQDRYFREAFALFEKSKSAWLRSSAREWLARDFANVPSKITERELALRSELNFYADRRKKKQLSNPEKEDFRSEVWQKRHFEAKRQLSELLQELETNYPKYYRLKYDYSVVSLKEVARKVQKKNVELITFFWGKNTAYVMVIHPNGRAWKRIEDQQGITDTLNTFHQTIQNGGIKLQEDPLRVKAFQLFCHTSRSLYQQLLAPVLSEQHSLPLVLIPDGPLGQLPFQILLSKESQEDPISASLDYRRLPYLLTQRAIQYESSITALLQPRIQTSGQGYLGFAPSFSYMGGQGSFLDSLRYTDQYYRTAILRGQWGSLNYNREEIETVNGIVNGSIRIGVKATEHQFKETAPAAKILHLATHAYVHDSKPDYSFLVFARDTLRPDDGLLHAYELYNLRLNAELAVLSACNTGAGVILDGEGTMSLSRAFQYAGCPAVLMSLWLANDEPTKDIIVNFFQNLNQGHSKSDALRQATLDFLTNVEGDELTHPFHWANFVVLGKDEAMNLDTTFYSWSPMRSVFLAVVLLSIVLITLVRRIAR